MFERRCRLLGKRLAGDEGESELDKQKASASIRRWTDKPTGMHHTHLTLDPERDAKLWAAIDAQLATIKQLDGNAGAPIDVLLVVLKTSPSSARGTLATHPRQASGDHHPPTRRHPTLPRHHHQPDWSHGRDQGDR